MQVGSRGGRRGQAVEGQAEAEVLGSAIEDGAEEAGREGAGGFSGGGPRRGGDQREGKEVAAEVEREAED